MIQYFCLDLDECVLETDNCHDNATCNNKNGTFHCVCDTGFNGNGVNCASKYIIAN